MVYSETSLKLRVVKNRYKIIVVTVNGNGAEQVSFLKYLGTSVNQNCMRKFLIRSEHWEISNLSYAETFNPRTNRYPTPGSVSDIGDKKKSIQF